MSLLCPSIPNPERLFSRFGYLAILNIFMDSPVLKRNERLHRTKMQNVFVEKCQVLVLSLLYELSMLRISLFFLPLLRL